MRRHILFGITTAVFSFLNMICPSSMKADSWEESWIEPKGTGAYLSSMDLDSHGMPHVVYIRNETLIYAKWNGTSWDKETIGDGYYVCAIKLDSNDQPHIAYTGDYFKLKYSSHSTSGWTTYAIDDVNIMGVGRLSLCLGNQDDVHISYYAKKLKYARWNGISWSTRTIDSGEENMGSSSSIDLDRNSYPRIAYNGHNNLKFAAWDGVTWSTRTIDTNDAGWLERVVMVIDKVSNIAHVAYVGFMSGVRHAQIDANSVTTESVSVVSGESPYIELDGNGSPIMSYFSGTKVAFAYRKDGSWAQEDVSPFLESSSGYTTTVKNDKDNCPNIVFSLVSGGLVYYRKIQSPKNLSGKAMSSSSIQWSWNDSSRYETKYSVRDVNGVTLKELTSDSTYWIETDLKDNQIYSRVINVRNFGSGADSNNFSKCTLAISPSAVGVDSIGFHSARVFWTDSNAARYRLRLSTDGVTWKIVWDWKDNLIGTGLFLRELRTGTTYYVGVAAYNEDGVLSEDRGTTSFTTSLIHDNVIPAAVGGRATATCSDQAVSACLVINFPADAMADSVYVRISTDPLNIPIDVDKTAIDEANENINGRKTFISRNSIREINVYNMYGARAISSSNDIAVEMTYPDDNDDGFLDNAHPPIEIDDAAVFVLNEGNHMWEDVSIDDIDKANKLVRFNVSHFSVYTIGGRYSAEPGLEKVIVYPNPYSPNTQSAYYRPGGVVFDRLAEGSAIKIFTIAGELVFQAGLNPGERFFEWPATNSEGQKVASGVYFFLITNGSGKRAGNLAIVK
ncbi:MAG: fibronectin type III domain-containing protein [Elusimicrobia bacterium]|nr:fibronectin type III domain-containing protein [Elusimicrobiota bacterium]